MARAHDARARPVGARGQGTRYTCTVRPPGRPFPVAAEGKFLHRDRTAIKRSCPPSGQCDSRGTPCPLEPTRKSKSTPRSACRTCSTNSLAYPRSGSGTLGPPSPRRRSSSSALNSTFKAAPGHVEDNPITRADERERPPDGSLGGDVQDHRPVRRPAHTGVRNAHYVIYPLFEQDSGQL